MTKKKNTQNLDNQAENTLTEHEALEALKEQEKKNKADYIAPYMWKKGQSGNPAGRPKGKTMKEYARDLLQAQSEEERQEFMHGLPKEIIWKMAEGNPENKTDITSKGEKIENSPELIARAEAFEEWLKQQLNGEPNTNTIAETEGDTEPVNPRLDTSESNQD